MATKTLSEHLEDEGRRTPALTVDLATLLRQMGECGRRLTLVVRRAALSGSLGLQAGGEINATGDTQKKLDVLADEAVLERIGSTGLVGAVVSEELKEPRALPGREARYVLCTDPLDGSSNTDIDAPMGTIFGIHRKAAAGPIDPARDLIRKGSEQVAAGYILYGPSTMMVYTAGAGAHGFTLDEERGAFVLTHETMKCPERGTIYSANLGNLNRWSPGVRRYVDHVTAPDPATRRPYSLRYIGALVGDVHRSLINGGIYFYPADAAHPDGKLRLMYECAPMAMIVEQAGGRASTGTGRILDIEARTIHQRTPLAIGSAAEVALYESFLK
ncbi:MAG: class 1 fructose-bisphosphatase [Acidobacteria bacterium]|nr:MAG: class 1 fructose-bisphosphatase [Acidobacteriota bacterium]